jgi:hypothetical protein
LSAHGREGLKARLAAGDPDDELWYAYIVKAPTGAVYRAENKAAARQALTEFYDVAHAADTPACGRLARTIRRWETEILAYCRTDGLSNARVEATKAPIKKIERMDQGFRKLDNDRLQIQPHCARHRLARSTRQTRGRSPRLMAKTRQTNVSSARPLTTLPCPVQYWPSCSLSAAGTGGRCRKGLNALDSRRGFG